MEVNKMWQFDVKIDFGHESVENALGRVVLFPSRNN